MTPPPPPPPAQDAGVPPDAAAPAPPPVRVGGFTHYTAPNYVPQTVMDVSGDPAGNVWVAGYDGVYLLRPGHDGFERFTAANGLQTYNVLSVAGMGPNEVWVGYEGIFGGQEDNDPEWMVKSGGVDRVKLDGSVLTATHYVIGTPPDPTSVDYPNGRYKIRNVYTIRPIFDGVHAGDVWFGGNHGTALWNERRKEIQEHRHCAINGRDPNGVYILMTGDFFGLAFDADQNVWIGGAHCEARIAMATSSTLHTGFDREIDTWPDPAPGTRLDDGVAALAMDTAGQLWIGSKRNGLARYDVLNGTWQFFQKGRPNGMPDKSVTALAADPDGSVWVGTYTGLGRYQPASGTWTHYYSFTHALPHDEITSLQIDARSSPRKVFIGSLNGVSIYDGP